MKRAVFPVVLMLSMPVTGWGQDAVHDHLDVVRKDLAAEQARLKAAQSEEARLNEQLSRLQQIAVELAQDVQASEAALAAATTRLTELESKVQEQELLVADTAKAQQDVLVSLVQLSRQPPMSVMLSAKGAHEAARNAAIMRDIMAAAEIQTQKLRQQIETLNQDRLEAQSLKGQRAQTLAALDRQRGELASNQQHTQDLLAQTLEMQDKARLRVADLGRQAQNLEDLIRGLPLSSGDRPTADAPAPGAPSTKPSGGPPQRGQLVRPVVGQRVNRFGQAGRFDVRNRGLTLRAAQHAVVVAPWAGEVAYTGPFRAYGNIVILQHPGGYFSVLAGMQDINVAVGQGLEAGAPVGQMGDAASGLDLYLEFRRNNTPVDPDPWLVPASAG